MKIRKNDTVLVIAGKDKGKKGRVRQALPEESRVGYQTVGGLVMAQFGSIPSAGQFFDWDGVRFEVMDMDGRRVDKVLVTTIEPSEENGRMIAGTD